MKVLASCLLALALAVTGCLGAPPPPCGQVLLTGCLICPCTPGSAPYTPPEAILDGDAGLTDDDAGDLDPAVEIVTEEAP